MGGGSRHVKSLEGSQRLKMNGETLASAQDVESWKEHHSYPNNKKDKTVQVIRGF